MSPVERVRSWAAPHTSLALELAALGVAVSVVPDGVSAASYSAIKVAEQGEASPPASPAPRVHAEDCDLDDDCSCGAVE